MQMGWTPQQMKRREQLQGEITMLEQSQQMFQPETANWNNHQAQIAIRAKELDEMQQQPVPMQIGQTFDDQLRNGQAKIYPEYVFATYLNPQTGEPTAFRFSAQPTGKNPGEGYDMTTAEGLMASLQASVVEHPMLKKPFRWNNKSKDWEPLKEEGGGKGTEAEDVKLFSILCPEDDEGGFSPDKAAQRIADFKTFQGLLHGNGQASAGPPGQSGGSWFEKRAQGAQGAASQPASRPASAPAQAAATRPAGQPMQTTKFGSALMGNWNPQATSPPPSSQSQPGISAGEQVPVPLDRVDVNNQRQVERIAGLAAKAISTRDPNLKAYLNEQLRVAFQNAPGLAEKVREILPQVKFRNGRPVIEYEEGPPAPYMPMLVPPREE